MDLRQLQYFLQIAECRSLTLAAAKVWISQPALSRQLQLLEADLGVQLFERRARGVVLTESGVLLRTSALTLMRQVEVMREEVGSGAEETRGHVHLGMTPSLRSMLTTPVAARYSRAFPKTTLSIKEGTTRAIRDAVAQGEVDVGLFSTQEPQEPLKCRPLLTEQLFFIGPTTENDSSRPSRRTATLHSLAGERLILTPFPNSLRQLVDAAVAKAAVKIDVRLEVETTSLMIDLVRAGAGHAVLPFCAIRDAVAAGQVSALPLRGMHISWVIGTSRERSLTRAATRVIDLVLDESRRLVGDGTWKTARLNS